MLPTLSDYQDFFQAWFSNLCFQLPQVVKWTDEITRVIRPKWFQIGPSSKLFQLFYSNSNVSRDQPFWKQPQIVQSINEFQKTPEMLCSN